MVPPTGVTDSILVVRRNGAAADGYYGAPANQLKNHPMESNSESRLKKQLGEKWRLGKSGKLQSDGQIAEAPGFVVHPDYFHKYGTLSNGVLTKSIKYAETWLYGTVGVRGTPTQRPSLFIYPGVVTPTPRIVPQNGQTGLISPPGAFIPVPVAKYPSVDRSGTGTLRPHKIAEHRPILKTAEICQCGDFRTELKKGTFCRICGGKKYLHGTLRGCQMHKGKPRETTISRDKTTPNASDQDPYNIMRKNRLVTGEAIEPSIFSHPENNQKRVKSLSPMRSKIRDLPSPSFETFKPKHSEEDLKNWKMLEGWSNDEDEDGTKRKSILECDVNAYELNREASRNSDDSSDELSDGALDVNPKLKILRPKLSKTDVKIKKIKIPEPDKLVNLNESGQSGEVRVSGQRFKIFDHSSPSTVSVEGYVSDDQDNNVEANPFIPRLMSPKRPPRKPKEKSTEENSFKYSKSKSKSSPNLSIKSILKKPTGNEDSLASDSPDTEQSLSPVAEKRREVVPRSTHGGAKSNQNTLKKKKQVQFKVSSSNESLSKAATEPKTKENKEIEQAKKTKVNGETVLRSQSCEDLLLVNEDKSECSVGNDVKEEKIESIDRKALGKDDSCNQNVQEGDADVETQKSVAKRTHSDRRFSAPLVTLNHDAFSVLVSPTNSSLFNDTMALRIRGPRRDSREIFANESGDSLHVKEESKRNTGAKEKTLPKKETPPPSLPAAVEDAKDRRPTGNLITYAEFTKLTDRKEISPDRAYLRRMRCKSLDNTVFLMKSGKSPPSPPPRQIHTKTRKLSSPGGTSIRLQVPLPDAKSDGISIVGRQNDEEKTDLKNDKASVSTSCESSNNKTIVTLSSAGEVPKENAKVNNMRPSVTIPLNISPEDFTGETFGKTSVVINNFHKEDRNKVTISVRSELPQEEMPNSSTCTIIETGSNSTVIPVMSTDNKTTLIVGNSSTILHSEEPDKRAKPSQYIFSNINSDCRDSRKAVEKMDPVEAVRRNLIPHICGKEENNLTLMEKIKQSRESKEQKNLRQISQLFKMPSEVEEPQVHPPAESLLATYQAKRNMAPPNSFKMEEDAISLADSFCSSVKNSSTNTSRSNSFRSNSYKSPESDYDMNPILPMSIAEDKYFILADSEEAITQERDKLEDEYEIRSGLSENKKDDSENIYETIKEEPIYDQIGIKVEAEESDDDIPPPLPLTLPPSLDEIDKRLPKSIFEGASKYDILSYLVDAKDRVQEDTYFSGSSISEEIDARRLSLIEDGERTSFDSGMHCRSPSDGLESEENIRRLENCKKDTSLESDSSVDLSSRISQISQASDSSDDNLILSVVTDRDSLKLNRKSSAEIERNDSGVGSETSQSSRSKWQTSASIREDPQHSCEDCDQAVETQVTDSGVMYAPLVCRKCSKRRSERKEIIQEIVETEEKYGRDLKIILEEFYRPMLVAGLLTPEQLSAIFLNTEELLENNEQLTEKLRDTLEIALEQGDEDLLTVNIGKLFLEAGQMLHAFESYCTRQATAAVLLANLEKEKELLRIFLRVSQMENTVLRRMNLNSFLMVPVQRVTKYPLLLARLYKVTSPQHESRELLKEAQHNIELHLEHMNSVAKDLSAIKVWRRFSASTASGRKSTAELEMMNIKLRKMAIDILEWNHEEVRFVMEGKLLYTQPTDNNWKRGRTIKLSPIFVLLVTLGKPNSKYKSDPSEEELTFPKKTGVREATLLLVKEKCGRYTLIREPLFLDKVIVCCETDADEYFEIQELSTKDTIIFKAEDGERTKEWYRQLQYHAQILGSWRKRRNALANIMINGMMARTYTS